MFVEASISFSLKILTLQYLKILCKLFDIFPNSLYFSRLFYIVFVLDFFYFFNIKDIQFLQTSIRSPPVYPTTAYEYHFIGVP